MILQLYHLPPPLPIPNSNCQLFFGTTVLLTVGLSSGSAVSICLKCRRCSKKFRFDPCVGKIPFRRKSQHILIFLPGKISWTEGPGRQQFMGQQIIGHDFVSKQPQFFMVLYYGTVLKQYMVLFLRLKIFFFIFCVCFYLLFV